MSRSRELLGKKPCKRDYILQKRSMILMSLLIQCHGSRAARKRALKKRLYSAKETYDFQEPTNTVPRSRELLGKKPYKRDYILQKRPIILMSLLIQCHGLEDCSEKSHIKETILCKRDLSCSRAY